MARYVLWRMLETVPVLLAAVTLTFILIRTAPGGPFTDERNFPEESIRQLHRHYGLDRPVYVQYFRYLRGVLRGDLGPSFKYPGRSVNEIIGDTFPVSLELGLYALAFALLWGIASGVSAALRPNSWVDHLVMGTAMTGICVPSFVLGPLLVLVFSLGFSWFNAAGWDTASDRVLPALTLGSAYAAYIGRLSRGSMLEVLPQDFIRTARAKGVSAFGIVTRHALRNAILPVIAFLGPATAGLITGSFVVETVFHIPGMGKMFVTAAFNRDYSLVLGLVVFYALLVVSMNLAADLLTAWINPRVRLAR